MGGYIEYEKSISTCMDELCINGYAFFMLGYILRKYSSVLNGDFTRKDLLLLTVDIFLNGNDVLYKMETFYKVFHARA